MQQALGELTVDTSGPGMSDVTGRIAGWLDAEGAADGLLTVFIRHTSASPHNSGKRRSRCAARPCRCAGPAGAGIGTLPSRHGGAGRYAGSHQICAHIHLSRRTRPGGPHGARHVAGHISDRASRPSAHAFARSAFLRRTAQIKSQCIREQISAYASGAPASWIHWPVSILLATMTAWVRLSTPSFCSMAETCALTVASDTPSS